MSVSIESSSSNRVVMNSSRQTLISGQIDPVFQTVGSGDLVGAYSIRRLPIPAATKVQSPLAFGGNSVYTLADGSYVHVFTSSGTFTASKELQAEIMVVAGGGAGGPGDDNGGGGAGGGGGGVIYVTNIRVPPGSYNTIVGNGGIVTISGGQVSTITNGENSVFGSYVAIGGGGAGIYFTSNGSSGGSGGGASRTFFGGSGTTGQGNAGGNGSSGSGGGGGGAEEAGANGTAGNPTVGGAGGRGRLISITGTPTYYGGGGGGGAQGAAARSLGGLGGGGRGGGNATNSTDRIGENGVANTGGGGGGSSAGSGINGLPAGNGGSGIVIIRYYVPNSNYRGPTLRIRRDTDNALADVWTDTQGGVTKVSEVTTSGGEEILDWSRLHVFKSSGNFTLTSGPVVTDVLVVAGGGGGGFSIGAGGGGGGLRYLTISITSITNTIIVGAGGSGSTSTNLRGSKGNNSTAFGIISEGGGGGTGQSVNFPNGPGGENGGSGGGGARQNNNPGSGIPGQGNAGGFGTQAENGFGGGGGGGAGGIGRNGTANSGGAGGIGRLIDITGTSTYYSGGGGGAVNEINNVGGLGGLGGGGNGIQGTDSVTASGNPDGTPNTGGGGGGTMFSYGRGGNGGSGIVIVRVHPTFVGREALSSWLGTSTGTVVIWYDQSGSGNHATTIRGNPRVTLFGTQNYLYGTTLDGIRFPSAILPSTYTLFHVARYADTGTQGRIFDGEPGDWASGFFTGTSGVAYHDESITPTTNIHGRNLVVSVDQNSPNLYRSNGVNRTNVSSSSFNKILTINYGRYTFVFRDDPSDWIVHEVLVYNTTLSLARILVMERSLMQRYLGSTDEISLTARTGARGLYALRELSGTWNGPTLTITRSSDGQRADLYFDPIGKLRRIQPILENPRFTGYSTVNSDFNSTYGWNTSSGWSSGDSSILGAGVEGFKAFNKVHVDFYDIWHSWTSGLPQWLYIKYPYQVIVDSYHIITHTNISGISFQFQGSDNGTSWTTIDSYTNQSWTGLKINVYRPNLLTRFSYYRLYFTASQYTWVYVGEWKLFTLPLNNQITDLQTFLNGAIPLVETWYDQSGNNNHATQSLFGRRWPPGNLTTPTSYTPDIVNVTGEPYGNGTYEFSGRGWFASLNGNSFGHWRAFDNNISTGYTGYGNHVDSNTGIPIYTYWLTIKLPESIRLSRYTLYGNTGGPYIASWRFYGSVNNTLVLLDQKTDITNWGTNEIRSFYINPTASYDFYRIDIDKLNIGSTQVNIRDIALYDDNYSYYRPILKFVDSIPVLDFRTSRFFVLPDGTVPTGNSAYSFVVQHGDIDNGVGAILSSGSFGTTHGTNSIRRDTGAKGYYNYWYSNDLYFGTYAKNNIIAMTYDGTTHRGYINGSNTDSRTPTTVRNSTSIMNLIGKADRTDNAEALNGDLYYVGIFGTALSQAEIQSLGVQAQPRQLGAIDNIGATPIAAFGLRLLIANYTGPIIRVRRSSDNAEADVFFNYIGVVTRVVRTDNTAILYGRNALSSFQGATTLFVTTWYDQSGNGNNATNTGNFSITNPILQLVNNIYEISCTNRQGLVVTNNSLKGLTNISAHIFVKLISLISSLGNSNPGVIPLGQFSGGSTGGWYLGSANAAIINDSNTRVNISPGFSLTTQKDIGIWKHWGLDYNGSTIKTIYEGLFTSQTASQTGTIKPQLDQNFSIGLLESNSNHDLVGSINQVLLFNTSLSQPAIQQIYNSTRPILRGALDGIAPISAAAFSLRLLYGSYAGPLIRVRRSTDNVEAEVFLNFAGVVTIVSVPSTGQVITGSTALSTFQGAATLFVTTWYDQSGNNRHATQTTTSIQPQLVLQTGKYAVYFDPSINDVLSFSSVDVLTLWSQFYVNALTNGFATLVGKAGTDVSLRFVNREVVVNSGDLFWTSNNTSFWYVNNIFGNTLSAEPRISLNSWQTLYAIRPSSSGHSMDEIGRTNQSLGANRDFNGYIGELIMYNTAQSSNLSSLFWNNKYIN